MAPDDRDPHSVPAPFSMPPASREEPERSGIVLIVDDDKDTRRLIRMWVQRTGAEVIEAEDGERGLALARENVDQLDAIILDVMMPVMDGFAVLGALQEESKTAEVPVILLTAHANAEGDIVRGIERGAIDHVAKPFRGPVLMARVRAIAEQRRAQREMRKRLKAAETLATQDPLTGLSNRRDFDLQLERETSYAARHDSPLALLLVDIDHFKSINDLYGHPEGDRVLQFFAEQIRQCLRRSDRAFRVGGEEFALLLRGADRGSAMVVAERLERALRNNPIFFEDGDSRMVTFSGGVATAEPVNGFRTEAMVDRADQALYRAKRTGRARTCVDGDDHEQTG